VLPCGAEFFAEGSLLRSGALACFFLLHAIPGCDSKKPPTHPQVRLRSVTLNPHSVAERTASLKRSVDSIVKSLSAFQDEARSNAALPTIEEAATAVIGLKLDRLPESHKSAMIEVVRPMVHKMVQVLKGLYKLPGVQAIIEPSISPMLSRLQAFANVKAD